MGLGNKRNKLLRSPVMDSDKSGKINGSVANIGFAAGFYPA